MRARPLMFTLFRANLFRWNLFTFGLFKQKTFEAVNMQMFVKMPSGKTLTLDVKSSVPIAYVKAKIQEVEGIPMREQRLTYNDKDLKDMRTLGESNVVSEATPSVMLRIAGGAGKRDKVVNEPSRTMRRRWRAPRGALTPLLTSTFLMTLVWLLLKVRHILNGQRRQ